MLGAPPDWIWLVLVSVGTFGATRVWPFVTQHWSAESAARRKIAAAETEDERQRYLKAFETTTAAAQTTAAALDKIAISLDMFGRDTVARTMEIAEVRREIRELRTDLGDRRRVRPPQAEEAPHAPDA